jgi:hypothetical protein
MTTKGKSFDGTEACARLEIFDRAGGSDIPARGYLPPDRCAIEPVRSKAKQGLTRA